MPNDFSWKEKKKKRKMSVYQEENRNTNSMGGWRSSE
jgi:hypothetical protein